MAKKPRFNPNKKKKDLISPVCHHDHDHKKNVRMDVCPDGYETWFVCHICHQGYTRPVTPYHYVCDKNNGALIKVEGRAPDA